MPDEDQDLAGLDELFGILVGHGLEHDEERIAVVLELWALVRLQRILDRELVQVELRADSLELLDGRLDEADPDERVVAESMRPTPVTSAGSIATLTPRS